MVAVITFVRGSWGGAPLEHFEKNRCYEIEFGGIFLQKDNHSGTTLCTTNSSTMRYASLATTVIFNHVIHF